MKIIEKMAGCLRIESNKHILIASATIISIASIIFLTMSFLNLSFTVFHSDMIPIYGSLFCISSLIATYLASKKQTSPKNQIASPKNPTNVSSTITNDDPREVPHVESTASLSPPAEKNVETKPPLYRRPTKPLNSNTLPTRRRLHHRAKRTLKAKFPTLSGKLPKTIIAGHLPVIPNEESSTKISTTSSNPSPIRDPGSQSASAHISYPVVEDIALRDDILKEIANPKASSFPSQSNYKIAIFKNVYCCDPFYLQSLSSEKTKLPENYHAISIINHQVFFNRNDNSLPENHVLEQEIVICTGATTTKKLWNEISPHFKEVISRISFFSKKDQVLISSPNPNLSALILAAYLMRKTQLPYPTCHKFLQNYLPIDLDRIDFGVSFGQYLQSGWKDA